MKEKKESLPSKEFYLSVTLVGIVFMSWLMLRSSSWTRKRDLFAVFFGDQTNFFLGVIAIIPVVLVAGFIKLDWHGNTDAKIPWIGFIYGFGVWTISYMQTAGSRAIFSQANGFASMPSGLADWWTIPDLVNCRDSTDCDRLGRPAIYGHGWKALFLLGNNRIALLAGALAAGYVCYSIIKYSNKMSITSSALIVLISPSMVFSLERGQSDIFAIALVMLIINSKFQNKTLIFLLSLFMTSLKPFFAPLYLKVKPKLLHIILLSPIYLFVYFLSMSFSFTNISIARNATLYPPNYQIGVDQLPSLFIQLTNSSYMIEPSIWKGAQSFKSSLIFGLVLYFVILAVSRKMFILHFQTHFQEAGKQLENQLVQIFSGIFLLIFLSGSQVYYKAWISFPILFVLLKKLLEEEDNFSPWLGVLTAISLLGTIGINIWPIRTIGTFFVALLAGHVLLDSFNLLGKKYKNEAKK
jgi:hypothetical protein